MVLPLTSLKKRDKGPLASTWDTNRNKSCPFHWTPAGLKLAYWEKYFMFDVYFCPHCMCSSEGIPAMSPRCFMTDMV